MSDIMVDCYIRENFEVTEIIKNISLTDYTNKLEYLFYSMTETNVTVLLPNSVYNMLPSETRSNLDDTMLGYDEMTPDEMLSKDTLIVLIDDDFDYNDLIGMMCGYAGRPISNILVEAKEVGGIN